MGQSLILRLKGVQEIIDLSHRDLLRKRMSGVKLPGWIPYDNQKPDYSYLICDIIQRGLDNSISLELGCGDGPWALLASAAGLRSFGIDADSGLVSRARINYFSALLGGYIKGNCRFAVGNIHHSYNEEQYLIDAERSKVMRTEFLDNPYEELGINIGCADIINGYLWPEHMSSLLSLLNEHARSNALFILPFYEHRKHHQLLDLKPVGIAPRGTALYRRARV
ncbi:class I SAM-dependent methyltransferase [Candidatus Pacearchaeota archaeon]|nr:class I SAM-dependent methyltransferase [Candidatus Pacearchaeota archaeon]